jgi:hypothetical protein
MEFRDIAGNTEASAGIVTGLVTPFNTETTIGDPTRGGFREQIAPGAFTKTLQKRDVVFLFNHDTSKPLARTNAGNLTLTETPAGLRAAAMPVLTSYGKDLLALTRAGVVKGMSFGFEVIKDAWTDDNGRAANAMQGTRRTIQEVRLHEVSAVTFPAYPTTEFSARDAVSAARGSHVPSARSDVLSAELATLRDTGARRRAVDRFMSAQEVRAAVDGQIKAAAARGIVPGISYAPAELLPPPKGYDIFDGRTCSGAGKDRKTVCGRPATAVLRTGRFDAPRMETVADRDASLRREMTLSAYGFNGMQYAGSGPKMGHFVNDPHGPPTDSDTFVCTFHSYAGNQGVPHFDDVPPVPEPVIPIPSVGSLGDLDLTRQLRVMTHDANYADVSDGLKSVLVRTSEYLEYLRAHGALPRPGERL